MKTELFKLDARNQVRIWICWVETTNKQSLVHVRYGINGHTLNHDNTPFRSYNHEQEAFGYAASKIRYMQQRRGYIDTIPKARPFRPMLLQRYKDRKDSLPPHIHLQPKLNGIRCLASKYWLKTRTNEIITSCPHILSQLQHLHDDTVLDGELYNHYLPLQQISGAVRTHETTPLAKQLFLWVFDLVEETQTFTERLQNLTTLYATVSEPHLLTKGASLEGTVFLLNTLYLKQEEIETHHNYFLAQGYEGTVIRNPRSHYQINTRSPGVLKHKPISTMNVKIMDIIPCKRAPEQGRFVLQNPKGGTFTCMFKAPHSTRERILRTKSKFIGQLVNVEFEDFSNEDVPLKPIATKIHGVRII